MTIRRYEDVWDEEGQMRVCRIEICGGIKAGMGIGERGGGIVIWKKGREREQDNGLRERKR